MPDAVTVGAQQVAFTRLLQQMANRDVSNLMADRVRLIIGIAVVKVEHLDGK
jgi:hypothetical protein